MINEPTPTPTPTSTIFMIDEDSNGSDDFISPSSNEFVPPVVLNVWLETETFPTFEAFTEWKKSDFYIWKAKHKGNVKVPNTKQMNYHSFKCNTCVEQCSAEVFFT
jgi:hypothetical protein